MSGTEEMLDEYEEEVNAKKYEETGKALKTIKNFSIPMTLIQVFVVIIVKIQIILIYKNKIWNTFINNNKIFLIKII